MYTGVGRNSEPTPCKSLLSDKVKYIQLSRSGQAGKFLGDGYNSAPLLKNLSEIR